MKKQVRVVTLFLIFALCLLLSIGVYGKELPKESMNYAFLSYEENAIDSGDGIIVVYKTPNRYNLKTLNPDSDLISAVEKVSNQVDIIMPKDDVTENQLLKELEENTNVLFAGKNFTMQISDSSDTAVLNADTMLKESDSATEIKDSMSEVLPDYHYDLQGTSTPNDPLFPQQWWYSSVKADKNWNLVGSNAQTVVAVIDSGVNTSHPDLQGRFVAGYDYITNSSSIVDLNGHGTSVAGCIAAVADNSQYISGVAGTSNVKIAPYRVGGLNASDENLYGDAIIAAVVDAANRSDVNVINLSFGGYDDTYLYSPLPDSVRDADPLYRSIKLAYSKGKFIVAASGNEGNKEVAGAYSYPASFLGVISVAATMMSSGTEKVAPFSQYNNAVDVAAPGYNIYTLDKSGGASVASGTSFSAPIVSGGLAKVLSMYPDLNRENVEYALYKTTRKIDSTNFNQYSGWGVMDLNNLTENAAKSVRGIAFNKTSLNLKVGASEALTVTYTPEDANYKGVAWISSNSNVATIDGNGVVTAVNDGTASIYAESVDGSRRAYCRVVVFSGSFNDVPTTEWYHDFVYHLVGLGILSGKGNNTFDPLGMITRAEFAKILAYASGDDLIPYDQPCVFSDSVNHWSTININWAYDKGIVTGNGNGFAPDDKISRQEMAVMLKRYADYKGVNLPQKMPQTVFADDSAIASWAKEKVYRMQQAGIINGKGNNLFDPLGNATRAEAAKMISVYLNL